MCVSNISICVLPRRSSFGLTHLTLVPFPQWYNLFAFCSYQFVFMGNIFHYKQMPCPQTYNNALILFRWTQFHLWYSGGGNLAERSAAEPKALHPKNRKSNQLLDFLVQQQQKNVSSRFCFGGQNLQKPWELVSLSKTIPLIETKDSIHFGKQEKLLLSLQLLSSVLWLRLCTL